MQRKFYLISTVFVIILLGVAAFFAVKKFAIPKKVHFHAEFLVFQNNKKLDFSDSKYMNLRPCVLHEADNDTPVAVQEDKAHLHDFNGILVHIERDGAIWKDLFTNLKFPIDYDHAAGYINGKNVSNFQAQPIHPYDSLVVFVGNNDKKHLAEAITKETMMKEAKKSVDCAD